MKLIVCSGYYGHCELAPGEKVLDGPFAGLDPAMGIEPEVFRDAQQRVNDAMMSHAIDARRYGSISIPVLAPQPVAEEPAAEPPTPAPAPASLPRWRMLTEPWRNLRGRSRYVATS